MRCGVTRVRVRDRVVDSRPSACSTPPRALEVMGRNGKTWQKTALFVTRSACGHHAALGLPVVHFSAQPEPYPWIAQTKYPTKRAHVEMKSGQVRGKLGTLFLLLLRMTNPPLAKARSAEPV